MMVMAPHSLKRTSTASTTITTMTSGMGPGSSLLDAQWQSQPPGGPSQGQIQTHSLSQPTRPHSFRHSHGERDRDREKDRLRSHHHHHPHYHHQASVTATSSSGAGHQTTNANKSLSNRITSLKKENKTTQTLSIVVGGFIACWLPFFFLYILVPACSSHCNIPESAFAVAFWLGYMNSALNPAIYTIFNKDFRRAFRRILFK